MTQPTTTPTDAGTGVPPPGPLPGTSVTFRRWHGPQDIVGMAAASAALRRHVGLLEPIDVEAMAHRYSHLVNSDPAVDCILAERDGAVIGYVRAEWHDLTDGDRIYELTLVVDPSAWGLGVADAMLAWGESRAGRLASANPTDRRSFLDLYVIDGELERTTAVEAHGYEAVRWDAEMLRPDLEDLLEAGVPDGYEIRAPWPDELPAVHAMFVAAFREHWGEWEETDNQFADWVEDPRFRRDLVVVAFSGGQPAAGVASVLDRRPDGSLRGLLDTVATHPDHRRRGLARATIAHSLVLLRAEEATSAYLVVDTDNHNRALALYESCGFRAHTMTATWRKPLPGPQAVL